MKKLKFFIAFLAAFFFTSCGDSTKIVGTSEEQNEVAINESSSSVATIEISSSSKIGEFSSSSEQPIVTSSSSQINSSSSTEESSSSTEPPSTRSSSSVESSSSTEIPASSSSISSGNSTAKSSSSDGGTESSIPPPPPPENTNSLAYYLWQFGVYDTEFDTTVMASKYADNPNEPHEGHPPVMTTEFDGYDVHPFTKDNIVALNDLYPEAAAEYAKIVESIANGDETSCKLYTYNVFGTDQFAAYAIAEVSPDTITILDIEASFCTPISSHQMIRFLFSYCGEEIIAPEIVHVTKHGQILGNKCPVIEEDDERLK